MDTPVDVIGRASRMLRALSACEPAGTTTSSLSRVTGIARPTAHRLLTSLMAEGLVDRDEATGRWLLGPELYLLGVATQNRYDVTTIAQPHVRRLSLLTGESAFFSARRGDETVVLLREDGSFPLRSHVLREGIRFPLGVASAGLVILAHLPAAEVDEFLERSDLASEFGPAHDQEQLRHRLEATRTTGWALNPGLIVEGSWGMAAAVFDPRDRPQWALTITGVERRFVAERQGELGELLLREAHLLSQALRHRTTSLSSAGDVR